MLRFLCLVCVIQPILLGAVHPDQTGLGKNLLHDWKQNIVLKATPRKPSRTAVLIIAPPVLGNDFVSNRWKIGQKVWEQYMNSNPNVDCFFLQSTNLRLDKDLKDQVWLEGNTLYIGDWWYEKFKSDRILHKTVAAIEWLLPNYTHFVRTNLNVFMDLNNLEEYMSTHSDSFYSTPIWQGGWYAIGYSIMFTADVATHIASEYRRLENAQVELISPNHADDGIIASLASGVWPYDYVHPFRCCPSLPFGLRQLMSLDSFQTTSLSMYGALLISPISFDKALRYCKNAPNSTILYRTKGGLNLNELGQLYDYLLDKTYPELTHQSIVDYAVFLQETSTN